MGLVHHDLCFGCGITNLFGLQMELEPAADGVAGRFFVKQDHQGPDGAAHAGVVASALAEAMALAVDAEGAGPVLRRLALELRGPAPVGVFVRIEAGVEERSGDGVEVSARATGEDGGELATATGSFVPGDPASV